MAETKNKNINEEVIEAEDFTFIEDNTNENVFTITFGVINLILGILILFIPEFITVSLELFFGFMLIVAGIVSFISAFWKKGAAIAWGIILGILTIFVGIFMIKNPFQSLAIITFMISIYFIVEGIILIVEAFRSTKQKGWGWTLFNGIITSILGIIILSWWPLGSLMLLGVLLGINLIVFGISGIMIGVSMKRAEEKAKQK